jgi:homoserine kinase
MTERAVRVRVPATVGNFGGVAAATVALDGALNVKVTLRADSYVNIRYFGENGERVPRDGSNLVVRALKSALEGKGLEFSGADLEIYSAVPVGVGLGSSAAAVLAGLIAADRLRHLDLDEKQFFELAAVHESRLENVRAAWLGGLVSTTNGGTTAQPAPEDFVMDVVIPHFKPLDAPFASTRDKEVPGLAEALNTRVPGVSIFLCGSGPAVGIVDRELRPEAVKVVQDCFARRGIESRSIAFNSSRSGARDWNAPHPEVTLLPEEPVRKPSLIPV